MPRFQYTIAGNQHGGIILNEGVFRYFFNRSHFDLALVFLNMNVILQLVSISLTNLLYKIHNCLVDISDAILCISAHLLQNYLSFTLFVSLFASLMIILHACNSKQFFCNTLPTDISSLAQLALKLCVRLTENSVLSTKIDVLQRTFYLQNLKLYLTLRENRLLQSTSWGFKTKVPAQQFVRNRKCG